MNEHAVKLAEKTIEAVLGEFLEEQRKLVKSAEKGASRSAQMGAT